MGEKEGEGRIEEEEKQTVGRVGVGRYRRQV